MADTLSPLQDQFMMREIIAFPRVEEFYNLLQDRLHMEIETNFLNERFTLIINALPRKEAMEINRYQGVPLSYAGIPRQRELLEGPVRQWKDELDEGWNYLDATDLSSSTAVVSSKLYSAFSRGTYNLKDIPEVGMGKLSDYFEGILYPESSFKVPTEGQKAEYPILQSYFNIMEDKYLSLPLIQFGEFDGVIHIVYKNADSDNINEMTIRRMIKAISNIYENMVLDWDLVSRNIDKSEAIQLSLSPIFYEQINRNPILKELKYDEYYKKYLPYFKERIRLNDRVIHSKIYSPYLKSAIISIMIDSYAHNISAHSLIALNWWFKRRADQIQSGKKVHDSNVQEFNEIVQEYIPEGFDKDRMFELLTPWLQGGLVSNDGDEEYDIIRYPGSLDREIHPLIKFLMQKGAFWSGIARDNHFGGEASNLFDVLWNDFINNPLYLGTIAKSEDIHKITIKIVRYAPQKKPKLEKISCVRPKESTFEGEFVSIDVKNMRGALKKDENGRYYLTSGGNNVYPDDHTELENMSAFVHLCKDYIAVKDILKDCNLFFPGEVVGRHAFFTMLENEIRNVKHYKGDDLKSIQENGLELCISLQETNVNPNHYDNENQLQRIGVWINTPTDLTVRNMQPLVRRKFEVMMEDIMDPETFAPRLGGTFQDKICAGMLFNNHFSKVQNGDNTAARDKNRDTLRDKTFYPWIIPATSPADAAHNDIEVCSKVKESATEFDTKYKHTRGFFKKYFHMWKASGIKQLSRMRDDDFVWENLARFKFVSLYAPPAEREKLWQKVRKGGVIRIIGTIPSKDQDLNIYRQTLLAYNKWLPEWFDNQSAIINILVDGQPTAALSLCPEDEETFKYYHTDQLDQINNKYNETHSIDLAHGGFSENPSVLRYRSHGLYKNFYMEGLNRANAVADDKQSARLAELFEVLFTKVIIFDNRIKSRIKNNERERTYRDLLHLSIFDESTPISDDGLNWIGKWEDIKKIELPTTNFMILHLSFIEKILLLKYGNHPNYTDENIGLFIQEEIIPHVTENDDVRKNFILVITSGRGRTKWWNKLNSRREYRPYMNFTIFRPIESIISGFEDALARKDDIELKHNLVKVLMGA